MSTFASLAAYKDSFPFKTRVEGEAAHPGGNIIACHAKDWGMRFGLSRYAAPVDMPVAKGDGVKAPRAGGAKAICREVFETCNSDKAAYVAACEARGIFGGTAKARWTDLVRESAVA